MKSEELTLNEYIKSLVDENIHLRERNNKLWRSNVDYMSKMEQINEYIDENKKSISITYNSKHAIPVEGLLRMINEDEYE